MVMQTILLYLVLFIVPFFIGGLYHGYAKEKAAVMLNWCVGFVICLGLLQILALPCMFLKTSLKFLTGLYGILLVLGCICSIVFYRKNYAINIGKLKMILYRYPWQILMMVLVVAYQMYMYIAYMHADADDSFYVALAAAAVDTNTLFEYSPYTGALWEVLPIRYVFSPFFVFSAVLSNVFGIHPTILSHTILPVVYLLLTYTVIGLLGYELFNRNMRRTVLFVAISGLVAIYFPTSIRTQSAFMLLRIWQGKAFLAAVLLPFVFYLGYRLFVDHWNSKAWIITFFTMSACCLVSSMGIMLGAISLGIIGILCAIYKRDFLICVKAVICCAPNIILAIAYLLCG